MSFELIVANVGQSLTQLVTGKLMTDAQIRAVTSNVVGRYFSDWFAKPKDEQLYDDRVTQARNHLSEATAIILELKDNLEKETQQLDAIAEQLKIKKAEAERYEELAKVRSEAIAAMKEELQSSLRSELEAQARKGRRLRQAIAFVVWLVTLVLGAYVPQIIEWGRRQVAAPPAVRQKIEPGKATRPLPQPRKTTSPPAAGTT